MVKLLTPGTGNQNANRRLAIDYIAENVMDVDSIDYTKGNIATADGKEYHVSAYAESGAAFVSTPGMDKSKNSIYESGLTSLMYRQLKKDKRSFVYEVDPKLISVPRGSSTASWEEIDKCSSRVWICVGNEVRVFDRR
ncbi:hypothetical protein [Amphritea sp. HPY]|uniref:hypothetical protein n=1 Tax=Amphritea sp. HPY TaxID=3421652 RepID=UPI003D7ECE39